MKRTVSMAVLGIAVASSSALAGVYIAPALYEAGFVSAAHTEQDIADTVAIARDVFKTLS